MTYSYYNIHINSNKLYMYYKVLFLFVQFLTHKCGGHSYNNPKNLFFIALPEKLRYCRMDYQMYKRYTELWY